MTGFFRAQQRQVPEHVLAVLLGGIDDGAAIARDAGTAGELFRVRKQMAPLGLQEVHDIEILALGLGVAPLCREKVNVRVAAEPAPGVHVAPALQPQRQFLLARRDRHPRAYRLVFKAAGHVDQHLATWQPALARAIDVGVADAAEPEVAADVDMPGVHIRIDPVMVAMRLVGNAVRGAEMHATGYGLPGLVVDHRRADPVPACVQQFQAHTWQLHDLLLFDLPPARRPEHLATLRHRDRRRGERRDLDRGGAALLVEFLAPAGQGIGQELARATAGAVDRERWPRRGRP